MAAKLKACIRCYDNQSRHLQAYYLIRAAQQREELHKQADALRETIAAAERDEAALTVAAGQLLDDNERLDNSIRRVRPGSSQRLRRLSLQRVYPRNEDEARTSPPHRTAHAFTTCSETTGEICCC